LTVGGGGAASEDTLEKKGRKLTKLRKRQTKAVKWDDGERKKLGGGNVPGNP